MAKKQIIVSSWLKITSYILIVIFSFSSYLVYLADNQILSSYGYGGALGATIAGAIMPMVIGIFCGNKCAKWASKIKKSPNVAYIVGFIFALLGLLGYWIYYKIKSKK